MNTLHCRFRESNENRKTFRLEAQMPKRLILPVPALVWAAMCQKSAK